MSTTSAPNRTTTSKSPKLEGQLSKSPKLKGQLSKSRIEELKKDINKGEDLITTIHNGTIAYFKTPRRTEIGTGMTLGNGNVMEIAIKTFEACFLEGDNSIFYDEDALMGAALEFDQKHVSIKKVELGKC